jgi:hypothetical protein
MLIKKYLRFKLDDKIAVAEKMRNHILNSLFGADEILLVPT